MSKNSRLDTRAASWPLFEVTHLPLSLIRGEIKSFIVPFFFFSFSFFLSGRYLLRLPEQQRGGILMVAAAGNQWMHARASSRPASLDTGGFTG